MNQLCIAVHGDADHMTTVGEHRQAWSGHVDLSILIIQVFSDDQDGFEDPCYQSSGAALRICRRHPVSSGSETANERTQPSMHPRLARQAASLWIVKDLGISGGSVRDIPILLSGIYFPASLFCSWGT